MAIGCRKNLTFLIRSRNDQHLCFQEKPKMSSGGSDGAFSGRSAVRSAAIILPTKYARREARSRRASTRTGEPARGGDSSTPSNLAHQPPKHRPKRGRTSAGSLSAITKRVLGLCPAALGPSVIFSLIGGGGQVCLAEAR